MAALLCQLLREPPGKEKEQLDEFLLQHGQRYDFSGASALLAETKRRFEAATGARLDGQMQFEHQSFSLLGNTYSPRDDQYLLSGEFVVSPECTTCEAGGHAPGEPYPYLHRNADGSVLRLPGFDSHLPMYMMLEHPDLCNLVPPDQTIPISQYNWGSTSRYSDTCDYIMQCMYEENTIIALEKTFWFKGYDGDQIFFITTDTTPISAIEIGRASCRERV